MGRPPSERVHGRAADVRRLGVGLEEEGDTAGAVPGGDGRGGAVSPAGGADRAALLEGGAGTSAAGDREDAARLLLQQWFSLSDPQAEGAWYDSGAKRRLAGVELSDDVIPE